MNAMIDLLAVPASWAWRVSLETAIPVCIVLLTGRLRWLPARWTAALCLVLFVRLLLPAVPAVSWRPDFLAARASESVPADTANQAAPWPASEEAAGLAVESAASEHFDEAHINPGIEGWIPAPHSAGSSIHSISGATLLTAAWTIGALLIACWIARSSWLIRGWSTRGEAAPLSLQRLWDDCLAHAGCRVRAPLRLCDEITSVAVQGFWRPVILVPRNLEARCSEDEIRSMFLHEIAHLQRHDVLWVSLGLAACAIHWFNPLAWLLLRRFTQDREMVCDDFALALMGHESRSAYGGTLLRLLEPPAPAMPAPATAFLRNHRELKHRLNNIMKPNRTTLWSRIVTTVSVPAVCLLALTTASADAEKKEEPRSEEIRKAGPRDGENREGEKRGPRDGEVRKEGPRDGESREGEKRGPRDGEVRKEGPRDGENREGEKRGPRDGEVRKEGARDGDREGEKRGPRDGEMKKEGAREGDRDGEGKKPGPRDGDEGAKPVKKPAFEKSGGEPANKPGMVKSPGGVVVSLDAEGNVVSSDGWVVPADTVRSKLQSLAQSNPDQTITLRATSSTPLDKVMSVLQIMKEAGIKNVSMGQGK